jgi:hypothetical protein
VVNYRRSIPCLGGADKCPSMCPAHVGRQSLGRKGECRAHSPEVRNTVTAAPSLIAPSSDSQSTKINPVSELKPTPIVMFVTVVVVKGRGVDGPNPQKLDKSLSLRE